MNSVFNLHFTDGKTEGQRSQVACLLFQLHVVDPRREPGLSDLTKAILPFHHLLLPTSDDRLPSPVFLDFITFPKSYIVSKLLLCTLNDRISFEHFYCFSPFFNHPFLNHLNFPTLCTKVLNRKRYL